MEKKDIIKDIKSIYILDNIFNYIKDDNFKDKLFIYSKQYQKKLNINFFNLKKKYLKNIGLNLFQYLYISPESFKKDFLKNKYDEFFKQKKLDKNKIEKIIYDIIDNMEIEDIDELYIDEIEYNKIKINIDSPLCKIISKTKNFGKYYTIEISQPNIDKYNLKDYYKKEFNDLNHLNINYNSIYFILDDINKANYLKNINIDFNKIKRMTLIIKKNNNGNSDGDIIPKNNNDFFETFSFENIYNNLIYLNLNFFENCKISFNLFKNINKFKVLKYLYIRSLAFDNNFKINLNSLSVLLFINCKNIIFSNISNENLSQLDLSYN